MPRQPIILQNMPGQVLSVCLPFIQCCSLCDLCQAGNAYYMTSFCHPRGFLQTDLAWRIDANTKLPGQSGDASQAGASKSGPDARTATVSEPVSLRQASKPASEDRDQLGLVEDSKPSEGEARPLLSRAPGRLTPQLSEEQKQQPPRELVV